MQGGLRRRGGTIATAILISALAPTSAAGQLVELDVGETVDGLRQGHVPKLPVVPEQTQQRLQQTTDRVLEPLRSAPVEPEPAPRANVSAPPSSAAPGVETEPAPSDPSPAPSGSDEPSARPGSGGAAAASGGSGADERAGGPSGDAGRGAVERSGAGAAEPTRAGVDRPATDGPAGRQGERSPLREAIIDVVEALPAWAKAALAMLAVALLISIAYGARTWRRLVAAERRASTDRLTGLANRTSAEDALARQLSLSERSGRSFAVVLFDLDHFKAVNDGHGHQTGDAALAAVGGASRETLRESDFVARFGGEEFLALLPDTDLDGALRAAEKLRLRIARTPVGGLLDGVTASFGVAAFPLDGDDASALIAAADRALYRAKENGRDRVSSLHIDAAVQPELPALSEPAEPAGIAA